MISFRRNVQVLVSHVLLPVGGLLDDGGVLKYGVPGGIELVLHWKLGL